MSGAIGAVVADLYTGYDRWFISIPAHGLEGIIAGFARGRRLTVQVALLIIAGFVMASTYFYLNVFIRGLPVALISYVRDLFGQLSKEQTPSSALVWIPTSINFLSPRFEETK